MIEAVLVVSLLNLAFQVLAAWQRHQALREHRRTNGEQNYKNFGGEQHLTDKQSEEIKESDGRTST